MAGRKCLKGQGTERFTTYDMDYVLSRKPLYPGEAQEPPCTVCLTGAAGYIGSVILCRLLAAGHTVHATYRDKDDAATLETLRSLPGAVERIRWFKADLEMPGSFDAAVTNCK